MEPIRKPVIDIFDEAFPSRDCRILFIGLGRSGKTTIADKLLTSNVKDPDRPSTETFRIYSGDIQIGSVDNPASFPVTIADYKGQKLSQIVIDHCKHSRFLGRPDQRKVNALIFVVDLFPDFENKPEEEILAEYQNDALQKIQDRVEKHKEYIGFLTLELFVNLVVSFSKNETPRHQLLGVRLVINKLDLLRKIISHGYLPNQSEATILDFAKGLFSEVTSEIEEVFHANQFNAASTYVVSATSGENLDDAFNEIFQLYFERIRQ